MRITGWPLTIALVVASLAISVLLFHYGIFFFFLPIVFIPFLGSLKFGSNVPRCRKCGLRSNSKYCPNCGTKLGRK